MLSVRKNFGLFYTLTRRPIQMVSGRHYTDTYDLETAAKLCQVAGIDHAEAERIRQELEHVAAIYRWEHARTQRNVPGKGTKRELGTLAKQTARLMATLDDISPKAAAVIELQANADTQAGILHNSGAPTDPSLFIRFDEVSEDIVGQGVDIKMLRAILGGLHRAAHAGAEKTHDDSSGKPKDLGLLLWLSNVKDLWHANSPFPFTRDVASDGEPITSAATFCLSAFREIEPDCPTSRVMNGMKSVIKQHHKRTGKDRA